MADEPVPLTDVRELSRLAYGFMASKALFAALDLDLFGHLAAAPTELGELVEKTGVPANRLATLVAALIALGLVTEANGRLANSPAAQRYLVRSSPEFFGDYYRLQIDKQIYPSFLHLSDGLAGRPVESIYELIQDPVEAEIFSSSQHLASMGSAVLVSRLVDFAGRRKLLDVAGGSGAFSIRFCRQHRDLRATIIDFPSVIEVARRFVGEAGLAERIDFVAGNALEMSWPHEQDVVLMSYLLSAVSGDELERLLDLATAALAPGGMILIHDFMLDANRRGPRESALWLVSYLAGRPDTISFSDDEIGDRLLARGFVDVRSMPLIPSITKLVAATGAGTRANSAT
jgi:ubiquinone/menaquinone biosynthesis C-methylase UbiE